LSDWRDSFRTFDWEKAFPNPEVSIARIKQLFAFV